MADNEGFGTQGRPAGMGGMGETSSNYPGGEDLLEQGRERGHEMLEHGKESGQEMLEHGKERLSEASDTGRNRIAGKLEEFGDRLEERGREVESRGGVKARAGHVAVRAGHALDESADYIRSHDFGDMRDDLERQIRERPLASVGVALGAGFLLARMLRD